jgi:hypothetical protein
MDAELRAGKRSVRNFLYSAFLEGRFQHHNTGQYLTHVHKVS